MPNTEEVTTLAQSQLEAGLDRARGADNMEEACRAGHDVLFETGRVLRGEAGVAEADRQRVIATLELLTSIGLNLARLVDLVEHPVRMVLTDEQAQEDIDQLLSSRQQRVEPMLPQARHGCCGALLGTNHQLDCPILAVNGMNALWRRPWRVGDLSGRAIHIRGLVGPDGQDTYVGMMETPELAALVVEAVNAHLGAERADPTP